MWLVEGTVAEVAGRAGKLDFPTWLSLLRKFHPPFALRAHEEKKLGI